MKTKMPGASKLKWARRDWVCLLPGILYTKSLGLKKPREGVKGGIPPCFILDIC